MNVATPVGIKEPAAARKNTPLWTLARQQVQVYSDLRPAKRAGNRLRSTALDYQASRAAECVTRLQKPGCVVLQDPTGTGKTVVALVTAFLLLDAPRVLGGERVEHVLVVAPNQAVARLWNERARSAGFSANNIRLQTGGKLRWQAGGRSLAIVTHSSMPDEIPFSMRQRLLVIVDEAHKGLGKVGQPYHDCVARVSADGRALLITATPFQMSATEFAQMLEIATPRTESTTTKILHKQSIERYGEALVSMLRATRNLSKDPDDLVLGNALKKADLQERKLRPPKESALAAHMMSAFDRSKGGLPKLATNNPQPAQIVTPGPWGIFYHVARILPELTPGAKASDAFLRMLSSSYEALRDSDAFERFQDTMRTSPLATRLNEMMLSEPHPKVNETATWAAKKLSENRHVLIFCVYVETQKALQKAIVDIAGYEGAAKGPTSAAQARKIHAEAFGREPGDTIAPLALVVRDNLSESIDLDGGKPCIVHHDLTWNPARFVQRMGRVTRASSDYWAPLEADVFVPVLDLELDLRLYDTMIYRARVVNGMLNSLPPALEAPEE